MAKTEDATPLGLVPRRGTCPGGRFSGLVQLWYHLAVKNSERLTHPLVRDHRDAPLRRASWDEALDRVTAQFRKVITTDGPDSFGLFSCSKSTNEMNYLAGKFARTVIGSSNIDSCNRT